MNIDLKGNVIIRHQSIPDCQWCDKAKEYLDEKGLKYAVVNADKMFFGSLMKETKSTSVPQIVIKGEFVGDTRVCYNTFLIRRKQKMKVPNTNWKVRVNNDWKIHTAHQYFPGKRSLVVSLPGAFTPI